MSLKNQKRIAAQVLKCSPYRIRFDTNHLTDIKEAITKSDIRSLVSQGVIHVKPVENISRGRARETAAKKRKGQRRGQGSRKGTYYARAGHKRDWITRIRSQRDMLLKLRDGQKIDKKAFRQLYSKAKGGFFRSVRHIKIYVEEQGLMKK